MRKSTLLALVVVVVALAASTAFLFAKYKKTSADYVDMKAAEESSRQQYAQTINAIAEIQDSLNAISVGEQKMQLESPNLVTEQQMAGPNGRQALDRIAMLRTSIENNKQRILKLEARLKSSGNKVSGLEKMVANLKSQNEEREQRITLLASEVDSLQTQVTGLATQVQQGQDTLRVRDQAIDDRQRELATVYVATGNRKALQDEGLVAAKGGLFGLGKTVVATGTPNSTAFTAVNTDQQDTVDLPTAKKAQVLTAQAPSSYELRMVDGHLQLHILDPHEFRKIRQLVILTSV